MFAVPSAHAQNAPPVLITQNVDESTLVTLGGNTRPEAKAKYDVGRVDDNLLMEHLQLLLKRSPQQEQDLEKFIHDLHDQSSPTYHRWLTAKQFGDRFGVSKQDRDTINNWLRSHGLNVNVDYPNGLVIDFSGTAGQLREALHTEIHNLNVNGVKHIANMSDPRIPAALSPAVVGVVSLHDFRPHTNFQPRAEYTVAISGTKYYLVVPGDLETIYNINPLFTEGITGSGQTIVAVEDTDVYTTDDWTSFRSVFGLSSYTDATITETHPAPPSGTNNCADPGENGDDREAILDAEYASASAPSAAIVLASCANAGTFGGLIALQNILNTGNTPPIVSMSYGECEAANGATSNAAFNAAFQQAVVQGISVFVSAGDDAAAGCGRGQEDDPYGIGVTGWGSSPYVVSVGGTDFGDTFAGTNATYWKTTNSKTYESAKSYVPEIPWDGSCASSLLAQFEGFSQTYGPSGFCNSTKGETSFLNTIGGSGGPSGCATGTPAEPGEVGGTCAGWPKPSYQSLLGNPSDGVRDIPDVALFAANGPWLHYYPYCYSGPTGAPCTGAPSNWPGAGGTSFTAPIMAGIQALVNQKAGARQGNPNFIYYSLAAAEYGTTGNVACNSTLGNAVDSSCIFYDVTQGDNDVSCIGKVNCYQPQGANGVLSTSNSAYQPAYATSVGWDFPTGIGTVNAYNLVTNWPATEPPAIMTPNSTTFVVGTAGSFTVGTAGIPVPSISETGALPAGVTFVDNGNGSGTLSGTPTAGGVFNISFTAQNGIGSPVTQAFTLTVNQPPAITSANNTTFTVGAAGSFTVSTTGIPVASISETGALPAGVTFIDNGDGTGTLSGTPAATGGFSISFTAQNGVGSPATQSFTLTIGKGSQTITFTTDAPVNATYNSSFTIAATGGGSGNPVTFTSAGSCSNAGATYTMTGGTGTCSAIANQAGNSNYLAASQVTETVNAMPASQTITFTTNAPASAPYNSNFTVAATASSGLTVAYSSAGVCSNTSATYTMTTGTGTCSVIANQAGNSNYLAAPPVTQTVNATLATQTITFTTNAPASAAYNGSFTVAATASSGLAVVYSSAGVCSNAGAIYTMTSGTGTCSVIANQAGNSNYSAAPQVTQTVNATLAAQTITFTTGAPATAAFNSNFTVAATTSSGLAVVYSSSGVCSNTGTTYTMTSGTGTCSVIANQSG
ncbi:MAG: protease pro-enzyme activation domain-containing protein, partial [Terriglobales bacterium]